MNQSQLETLNTIEEDCEKTISDMLETIRNKDYANIAEFSQDVSPQKAWLDVYRRTKLEQYDFLKGEFLTFRFVNAMLEFYNEINKIRASKFPAAAPIL
jgi:hypothetical protein